MATPGTPRDAVHQREVQARLALDQFLLHFESRRLARPAGNNRKRPLNSGALPNPPLVEKRRRRRRIKADTLSSDEAGRDNPTVRVSAKQQLQELREDVRRDLDTLSTRITRREEAHQRTQETLLSVSQQLIDIARSMDTEREEIQGELGKSHARCESLWAGLDDRIHGLKQLVEAQLRPHHASSHLPRQLNERFAELQGVVQGNLDAFARRIAETNTAEALRRDLREERLEMMEARVEALEKQCADERHRQLDIQATFRRFQEVVEGQICVLQAAQANMTQIPGPVEKLVPVSDEDTPLVTSPKFRLRTPTSGPPSPGSLCRELNLSIDSATQRDAEPPHFVPLATPLRSGSSDNSRFPEDWRLLAEAVTAIQRDHEIAREEWQETKGAMQEVVDSLATQRRISNEARDRSDRALKAVQQLEAAQRGIEQQLRQCTPERLLPALLTELETREKKPTAATGLAQRPAGQIATLATQQRRQAEQLSALQQTVDRNDRTVVSLADRLQRCETGILPTGSHDRSVVPSQKLVSLDGHLTALGKQVEALSRRTDKLEQQASGDTQQRLRQIAEAAVSPVREALRAAAVEQQLLFGVFEKKLAAKADCLQSPSTQPHEIEKKIMLREDRAARLAEVERLAYGTARSWETHVAMQGLAQQQLQQLRLAHIAARTDIDVLRSALAGDERGKAEKFVLHSEFEELRQELAADLSPLRLSQKDFVRKETLRKEMKGFQETVDELMDDRDSLQRAVEQLVMQITAASQEVQRVRADLLGNLKEMPRSLSSVFANQQDLVALQQQLEQQETATQAWQDGTSRLIQELRQSLSRLAETTPIHEVLYDPQPAALEITAPNLAAVQLADSASASRHSANSDLQPTGESNDVLPSCTDLQPVVVAGVVEETPEEATLWPSESNANRHAAERVFHFDNAQYFGEPEPEAPAPREDGDDAQVEKRDDRANDGDVSDASDASTLSLPMSE